MNRLARPPGDLQEHYDVVVVGSGYGGSIAACRLSRAGRRVALFERGRELHPGEFPTTLAGGGPPLQTTSPRCHRGPPLAVLAARGDNMSVFSGCGLGGTSLVNANVSLLPDPRVFEDERWPQALRADRPGMSRRLRPGPGHAHPGRLSRLVPTAGQDARPRGRRGRAVDPTPVNVTFRAGPNGAGVHQEACTGCGDCVTGCNVGAKNTLLMNYLPDAVAHGTEVFCETEVQWVQKAAPGPDGAAPGSPRWVVHVQPLGTGRDRFGAPPLPVTADVVILAAGTLGSTGVLFRSREKGLTVSPRLGQRFTGNGDVLGFAWRPPPPVYAVGAGRPRPGRRPSGRPAASPRSSTGATASPSRTASSSRTPWCPGPSPASSRRLGPQLLAAALRPSAARRRAAAGPAAHAHRRAPCPGPARADPPGDGQRRRRGRARARHRRRAAAVAGGGRQCRTTAAPRVRWPRPQPWGAAGSCTTPCRHACCTATSITVHPLGGCVMAEDAGGGVVDHRSGVRRTGRGRGPRGTAGVGRLHRAPSARGEPLLTISALAERGAYALAAANGWAIDDTAPVPRPASARPPP